MYQTTLAIIPMVNKIKGKTTLPLIMKINAGTMEVIPIIAGHANVRYIEAISGISLPPHPSVAITPIPSPNI